MSKEIVIIKHVDIEGPGSIDDFFRNTARCLRTIELGRQETFPRALDDTEGIIVLGGPMNVYEEEKYPFLKEEDAFLKKVLDEEIPVLGICLGAQLLAKARGSRVSKAKTEEVGWSEIRLTAQAQHDPLFRGLPSLFDVFEWHEDTFDIPADGALLATNAVCRNQAARFGRSAWGIQFHIEVTMEMLNSWFEHYEVSVSKETLFAEYFRKEDMYRRQAMLMYLNFARVMSAQRKRQGTAA